MQTLTLGTPAHVNAGKTSHTERLLHAAGVIDAIGSVDDGNTHTHFLALERQRGFTIETAVVSYALNAVTANLTCAPGHSDLIGEAERVLPTCVGDERTVSSCRLRLQRVWRQEGASA